MSGAPVTVLTNSQGRFTKRFFKDAAGAVAKSREPALWDGDFVVRRVANLDPFAALLDGLTSSQAVTYGRPIGDAGQLPDRRENQPRRAPTETMPALAIISAGSTPLCLCGEVSGTSLKARCSR